MSMTLFHRNGREASERDLARAKPTRRVDTFSYPDQLPCGRCGGQGGSEAWRHTGWTCYQCGGHGRGRIIEVKLYTRERLDMLEAAAKKKADKKAAELRRKANKKRLEFIAWVKEDDARKATVGRILRTGKLHKNDFISDLAGKLRQRWTLSEKQLDAADRVIDSMEKRAAEKGTSAWVGDIKERLELEVLVLFVYETQGFYGPTDIILMKDAETGNLFKWFNSGSEVLNKGARLKIKGTVKKHDEYKGEKQTVLTRCTVLEKYETVTADEAAEMENVA